MPILFDKHERPTFEGLDNDAAFEACQAYEDYAYSIADTLSDENWDAMIADVRAVYAEYYAKYDI